MNNQVIVPIAVIVLIGIIIAIIFLNRKEDKELDDASAKKLFNTGKEEK